MKTNKEILMKFVSTQGYKRNSPDKNRPVNVIPSNEITMQGVDFPVRGVDNLGNEMVMQPGEEYTFPGDYVVETPAMQQGGENDREMVEGIADILTQVTDPANRRRIAKNMVADFKRENVNYNLQDFLSMAKVQMKEGGQHGGLDRWFAEKWVDVKTGKECGRQEGENRKGYPACRPSKRISEDTPKTASELSSSEKEKFKRTKTSSERIPYQHQRKEEGGEYDMEYMKDGGNVPTNPELWSRAKAAAKSKYDVYPSAYANGYAAKWYKEKGGGWKKAQKGGSVPPVYVSDKNDPRLKAYTDSLDLYEQGVEPFVHFDDFSGKKPLKEYAKKNYVPGKEGKPVTREQILREIDYINEELISQDRPALIKNANERLALLKKSLETGVYPANLVYPEQQINALVYKKPVVPVEYKKPNTIVKEESYDMNSKQIGSEEQKQMGGCMECGGPVYADGGAYNGYMTNPMEMFYQEGGESEQPQQMQQEADIEAAIGEISSLIAQGEDPSDIYDMLIESGVPEQFAQGYLSEAMSDLEEDDMEEEDVPMDDDEMAEFEEYADEEEDKEMYADDEEEEEETKMKRGGSIKIKPSRKGTFKAQATKMGMSVAEAADYILRHKEEFSPAMVKKANFAKNFAKELGGEIYNLDKFKNGGGIPDRYRNLGFTRVGAKRRSTRPGKKWMVLAKKGDKYKVVHGGYKGMSDYTQHRNPKRRERFWNRMGGKNSAKATDPFSPLYWHKRFGTWEQGGGVYTGSKMYKAQTGGPSKTYDQWLNENMNRPDVFQNSQSPDYLASLYQMEVPSTPSQTPAIPRMTRTGGSGMGAMEILDPMVPNADNPYDLTLPATPTTGIETDRLVAPPGWNAMNNTEGLSKTGTMVQEEPTNRSGFNWRRNAGDIMLSSMGVINQLKMRKDYEKEYKQRLRTAGNTDQRYDAYNPSNPFGNYTLNAGPGSNFALVTNTPMQDFGTRMAGARYGGTTSYKKGGEYYATDEEIQMILAMGGEIEFLD